jgi:hypothetical protein
MDLLRSSYRYRDYRTLNVVAGRTDTHLDGDILLLQVGPSLILPAIELHLNPGPAKIKPSSKKRSGDVLMLKGSNVLLHFDIETVYFSP